MGGTLAEHLANEANDITVDDTNTERMRNLGDRLDIGSGDQTLPFPTIYAKPVVMMPTCWWS